MTRIGILHGRERAFPQALLARLSALGRDEVAAEPAVLGGVTLDEPRSYDIVLDRISHEFPYYRAALAKLASDGARIVPDPTTERAPDRFQTALLATRLGVPVTRRAVLPPREHPIDITAESLGNLLFPLDWERLFATVGFPALLRPLVRRANEPAWVVGSPRELFDAHARTGSLVMVVEQLLPADAYLRALVVGREVLVMRDEPAAPSGRYAGTTADVDRNVLGRVTRHATELAAELGHDVVAMDFVVSAGTAYLYDAPSLRPLAEPELLGEANFAWFVEQTARYLLADLAPSLPAEPATRPLSEETTDEIAIEPVVDHDQPAPVVAAPPVVAMPAKAKERDGGKAKSKESKSKKSGSKAPREASSKETPLDMAELAARGAREPLPIIELDEPAPTKKAKGESRGKKGSKEKSRKKD